MSVRGSDSEYMCEKGVTRGNLSRNELQEVGVEAAD